MEPIFRRNAVRSWVISLVIAVGGLGWSWETDGADFQAADAVLKPYEGPAARERVPADSLHGLVMCGYQGWFNTPGDGGQVGFVHYQDKQGRFDADHCSIDFWPDLSEAAAEEKVPTPLRHRDGSTAYVYSSRDPRIIDRHFRWMQEYGISGVFVQRFVAEIRVPKRAENFNTVLTGVRAAANAHGRVWALMYDTSNCENFAAFRRDWEQLTTRFQLGKDPAYLHHRGKPLVALWGLFAKRPGSIPFFRQAMALVRQSGFSVMLGTDSSWRTDDGPEGEAVRELIAAADVLSPWQVGRYDLEAFPGYFHRTVEPDAVWCRRRGVDYLPVVFPGFSWWNLQGRQFDAIPRHRGRFLQRQIAAYDQLGAKMLYVAMFDEMDEGTCIMKVHSSPPEGGRCRFLSYAPDPPDHYLKLVGAAARTWRKYAATEENQRHVSKSLRRGESAFTVTDNTKKSRSE